MLEGIFKNKIMNVPNALSFMRIAAIAVMLAIYMLPFSWAHPAAAIVFALAAGTDWLDGFLARRLQQVTRFGAFLDPVADKLIVSTALVLVVRSPDIPYITIPVIIIICRELVISALREWMAEIGQRTSVAVSFIAKIKTTIQMIALFLLLWYHPNSLKSILLAGEVFIYIAAILTVWSMVMYLKAAWPDLTLSENS